MVGSGPNGLAAAITLARAGWAVLVLEAQPEIGGGTRSAELTLPGFVHDVCSSIHPMARLSPFFRTLPLAAHGLEWVDPPAAVAHPLDSGWAALLAPQLETTGESLGPDAGAWRRLMEPFVKNWSKLEQIILAPPSLPRYPVVAARFGLRAMWSATGLARAMFREERARALFAGLAAHSFLPLERTPSAAFGLVLGITAHLVGWPFPRGGSARLAAALASYLRTLGGQIETSSPVRSLDELPPAQAILCDVTPRQLLAMAGRRLPRAYRRKLEAYRYGPGAFKMDWALDGPIPWKSAACALAATVHLGGTLEEVAESERAPWQNRVAERPFVLVAQTSLFDTSRAPAGKHTAWAYCHVPNGCTVDISGRIEAQIERFAPGFRDRILARSVMAPAALEAHNANLVGGDIGGGVADLGQLFLRPTRRLYSTPVRGLYLCSASTPPGGGVHGLCGHHAAHRVLDDFGYNSASPTGGATRK